MTSIQRLMPFCFVFAVASCLALALTARSDDFGTSPIVGISLLGFFLASAFLFAMAVFLTFKRSRLSSLAWLYFVSSMMALIVASAFVPAK